MINDNKVSAVVTVYNTSKYIERFYKSIKDQVDEIILVDDVSKDNTRDIIKRLSKKDKKIKLILHEKNQGISHARNNGIKAATNEFTIVVDGDFVLDKNWVSMAKETIKLDEKIGAVSGYSLCPLDSNAQKFMYVLRSREDEIFPVYVTQSFLLRSSVIKKYLFDPKNIMGEDIELCNRLRKDGFYFVRIPVISNHLGDPTQVSVLLMRQKKYGILSFLENKNKINMFSWLFSFIMVTPLNLFSAALYFEHIAKQNNTAINK
ncbi:MAG: glycosyltransferase family A protein [archaeon]